MDRAPEPKKAPPFEGAIYPHSCRSVIAPSGGPPAGNGRRQKRRKKSAGSNSPAIFGEVLVMAIAYFRASICGGGSSPVAAAAYQAAQNLHDETDNREKNYTHKEEVVAAGIELPENAPADFADREKLWNAVQRFENAQKNSSKQPPQYARKLVIALPDELTTAQKIGAAEDLAQFFAQQGMCADWALHNKNGNPHLHFMLTTRPFLPGGEWGQKRKRGYKLDKNGKKIPVLDKNGRQKIGAHGRKMWQREDVRLDWGSKKWLENSKKKWEDICNERLKIAGKSARVDFRYNEKHGLLAQKHLGPVNARLERDGIRTEAGDYNRAVSLFNLTHKEECLKNDIRNQRKRIVARRRATERDRNRARSGGLDTLQDLSRSGEQLHGVPDLRGGGVASPSADADGRAAASDLQLQRAHGGRVGLPGNGFRGKIARGKHNSLRPLAATRGRGRVDLTLHRCCAVVEDWAGLTRDEHRAMMCVLREAGFSRLPEREQGYMGAHALYLRDARGGIHLYAGVDATALKPGQRLTGRDLVSLSRTARAAAKSCLNEPLQSAVLTHKADTLTACRNAAKQATASARQTVAGAHAAGQTASQSGGKREAVGRALDDAFSLLDSRTDPKKHLKEAGKAVGEAAKTPAIMARDIISNPLSGLIKAPFRVAEGAANLGKAAAHTAAAMAGGKESGQGLAAGRQRVRVRSKYDPYNPTKTTAEREQEANDNFSKNV